MGNWASNESGVSGEALDEYVELTYLSRSEIRQIYKLLDDLEPGALKQNLHYRFPTEQIDKILPHIRCNPFRDAIYRVFSSKRDGCLSFEDTLDLCSAFSANCPQSVRAAWAFEIFDFDDDNQLSLDDLIETIQRLTGTDERGRVRIDPRSAEDVAQMVDPTRDGSIWNRQYCDSRICTSDLQNARLRTYVPVQDLIPEGNAGLFRIRKFLVIDKGKIEISLAFVNDATCAAVKLLLERKNSRK